MPKSTEALESLSDSDRHRYVQSRFREKSCEKPLHMMVSISTIIESHCRKQETELCLSLIKTLVVCMYLVFTRMPGECYRRRLRSLSLYLCYVFRALINSLVC